MATFSARNCPVGYTIEGVPTCTTRTRTKPTEEYYIFHESAIRGLVDWGTASDPDLSDWNATNATISVESRLEGNKNIQKIIATANAGYSLYSFTAVTSGTLEGWTYIPSTNAGSTYIVLRDGGVDAIYLFFKANDDLFTYTNDGNGETDSGINYTPDTWIHYKITWIKNGAVEIYINGVNVVSRMLGAKEVDQFLPYIALDGEIIYIDAIGFSWDGYRSASGFDTQDFEGFVDRKSQVHKSGFWNTTYKHPLWFDLQQPVYKAATNATPHAYIKDIIDTYFKFCRYTSISIDESFGAMDIPAYNGQSVAYVLRFFNILKKNWWYCDIHSLNIYWDDGTRYSGKNILFGTQPVINPFPFEQELINLVTMTGGYDSNGDLLTSTNHAATPGSQEITENFPEIVGQTLLDALSLAGREVWEQVQIYYTMSSAKRGLHQYGRTGRFSTGKPLSLSEATFFIHSATYDLVTKISTVRIGVFMMLPFRSKLKGQELRQLVDNIEKNIHWVDRDTNTPIYDESTLTDDVAWNDYDLSAIVGTKKMMVYLHIEGVDNATGSKIWARPKGNTSDGPPFVHSVIANQEAHDSRWIFTNTSGVIQIKCVPAPSSWTSIDVYLMDYRDA